MYLTGDASIGEIVARDFRAATVFREFGIDFCCGGRSTLNEVCRQRNLDADNVLSALDAIRGTAAAAPRFDTWTIEELIGHIVETHHAYVRRVLPSLLAFTGKLARAHGSRHPELTEIAMLIAVIAREMTSHMASEEGVLFPYMCALAESTRNGLPAPDSPFGSVENPLRVMEDEHEAVGAAMARISELTGRYSVPEDGCTTYRVCFEELAAFERDLHEHVHLENNILFPAVRKLSPPASLA